MPQKRLVRNKFSKIYCIYRKKVLQYRKQLIQRRIKLCPDPEEEAAEAVEAEEASVVDRAEASEEDQEAASVAVLAEASEDLITEALAVLTITDLTAEAFTVDFSDRAVITVAEDASEVWRLFLFFPSFSFLSLL